MWENERSVFYLLFPSFASSNFEFWIFDLFLFTPQLIKKETICFQTEFNFEPIRNKEITIRYTGNNLLKV